MNIKKILQQATTILVQADIDSAQLDAKVLLKFVLGFSDLDLILKSDYLLSSSDVAIYSKLIERRCKHEPIAYMIGHKEFWGLNFKVTPDTLIPRPASELFIENALDLFPKTSPLRILDLGTGSGCLLLSLLHEFTHATGMGIDQSEKTLCVAQENATALGLEKRATWLKSDWCDKLTGEFDLIVANPPYIKADANIMPDVAKYEPHAALYGGTDGFAAYKTLIPQLKRHTHANSYVFFEIGQGQAPEIEILLKRSNMKVLAVKQDLESIERLIICSF